MPDQNQAFLAAHEALELHEMITASISEIKKIQGSLSIVQDPDLASLMHDLINSKTQKMRELHQFISSNDGVQQ